MRRPFDPDRSARDFPPLDGATAERLACGRTAPDDAPPGYEGVASILAAAARAVEMPGPGLGDEAATVAAMAAVLTPATPPPLSSTSPSRRFSMIPKLLTTKVAAVAMGALVTSGAAAAAGALPGPLQDAVSSALSTVGLDLPDGGSGSGSSPIDALVDDTTTTTVDDETTTTTIDDSTTTTVADEVTTTTVAGTGTGGSDDNGEGEGDDACVAAGNHGQFVSGVARNTPSGPGHGAVVSEAAKSDCGKAGDDQVTDGDGDDDGTGDDGDTDSQNHGPGSGGPDTSNRGPGSSGGNSGHGNSGHGGGSGNSGRG